MIKYLLLGAALFLAAPCWATEYTSTTKTARVIGINYRVPGAKTAQVVFTLKKGVGQYCFGSTLPAVKKFRQTAVVGKKITWKIPLDMKRQLHLYGAATWDVTISR